MASVTQWTWVWANSGRWWRTGKPGMLQPIGWQRIGHDSVTEQPQKYTHVHTCILFQFLEYSSLHYTAHLCCLSILYIVRPWCWEGLGAGGEGDDRGWDGWLASRIQWIWVWANSRRYKRTGKPGMLQPMQSQRAGHNWVTEQQQQQTELSYWDYFRKKKIKITTNISWILTFSSCKLIKFPEKL